MKHIPQTTACVFAALFLVACARDTSTQNGEWRTHTDARERAAVTLPSTWVGFSAYDGTAEPIQYMGDYIEYGEPDGMRMLFELFDDENAARDPGESWHAFFLRLRLDASEDSIRQPASPVKILKQEKQEAAQYHLLFVQKSDPSIPRYYALFERNDLVISLGFYEDNPLMHRIIDSLKFL